MNSNLTFEEVVPTEKQVDVLFGLLKDRVHNISHDKKTTLDQHIKFVYSNPYRHWFLILFEKEIIGSFYIQYDNSVGLNILKLSSEIVESVLNYIKINFEPMAEEPSKVPKNFYLNVPSSNSELINILKKNGLKNTQVSYQIE